MTLVGFAGLAQHGKDTAAQFLVSELGFKPVAFADPVRRGLLALDPYVECIYLIYKGMHEAGLPVPQYWERLSVLVAKYGWDVVKQLPEVRRLKQRYGTEAGRDIHGYDCWVNLMREILDNEESDVVVTDIRFDNEAGLINEYGGRVYHIWRPNFDNGLSEHRSEPMDFSWADTKLENSGTVEHLRRLVLTQVIDDFQLCTSVQWAV
jgi:hypothetical protein